MGAPQRPAGARTVATRLVPHVDSALQPTAARSTTGRAGISSRHTHVFVILGSAVVHRACDKRVVGACVTQQGTRTCDVFQCSSWPSRSCWAMPLSGPAPRQPNLAAGAAE